MRQVEGILLSNVAIKISGNTGIFLALSWEFLGIPNLTWEGMVLELIDKGLSGSFYYCWA